MGESQDPIVTGIDGDGKPFTGQLHVDTHMGNWVWAYPDGAKKRDSVRMVPDAESWARIKARYPESYQARTGGERGEG